MMPPLRIAIVGLGARTFKKSLRVIANDPKHWQLVAATDPLESRRLALRSHLHNLDVPVFQEVTEMLEWHKSNHSHRIDAVYVAVLHHCYVEIIPHLLSAQLHVLKEKPAAIDVQELKHYQDLAETNSMKDWLPFIGQVSYIEAKLKICVSDLGEGWRAQSALAGGGAMADVGWRLLDMVIELANVSQDAQVVLEFASGNMTAHMTVSRIGHKETEEIIITGEKGTLTFDGNTVVLHFKAAVMEESLRYDPRQDADHKPDIEGMFAKFYDLLQKTRTGVSLAVHSEYSKYRIQDMIVTQTLQAIYQYISDKDSRQHQPHAELPSNIERAKTLDSLQALAMVWPIIDETLEAAVTAQLHKEISIYGNGGVSRQRNHIDKASGPSLSSTHLRSLQQKRCKLEIPADHYLHQFALTGAGLKNRAHPLAVAIALDQLRKLPEFHNWKTKYAAEMIARLSKIPFLDLPAMSNRNGIEPAWYAFTMRFKHKKAPKGLTRKVFAEELRSMGLVDVDIPRSTGLLHREPLYTKPQELFPHLYSKDYATQQYDTRFVEAEAFYEEAIKLPVYATAHDQAVTDRYVETILKVANMWVK
ncbi:MAG: hypothetical protein Q9209_005925 [Squamulea sp. 1 TL-2023]